VTAMAEIINLRKARKKKARAEKEAEAAENRAKFGRPKEERSQSEAAKDLLDRKLDAHRREDGDPDE
jgi:Domain of unknown function (DUF4169)